MKVKFWGTRGSIPVATNADYTQQRLRQVLLSAIAAGVNSVSKIDDFIADLPFVEKGAFGGNTSCVQLDVQSKAFFLCDLGTGVREFASYLSKQTREVQQFNVFMSHLHWDHIMGFPFFSPVYRGGNKIRIFGCHDNMEQTFRRQHHDPNFPVDFSQLSADIEFIQLQPDKEYQIDGVTVLAKRQIHEGDSYGYRFEHQGQSVIYSTDSEHRIEDQQYLNGVVDFFSGADLVIFDAMYSLLETVTYKRNWGHSNNLTGVELCQRAKAKQICLFHHEPAHNDQQIMSSLQEARDYEQLTRCHQPMLQVDAAYDGLELDLSLTSQQRLDLR